MAEFDDTPRSTDAAAPTAPWPTDAAPVHAVPSATALAPPVLAAALALGALGDALLRPTPWGLGAALWVAVVAAATVLLARRAGVAAFAGRGSLRLVLPALLAVGALAWRDSPTLKALDVLAALLALALAAVRAPRPTPWSAGRLRRPGGVDYALGALTATGHALAGAIPLIAEARRDAPPRSQGGRGAAWGRHAAAAGRGLVIAAPLLLVFGGLLAAADAIFADLLARPFDWNLDVLVSHLLLALVLAWLAGGFLRAAARDAAAPRLDVPLPAGLRLGPVEVGVVLGSLDALFLLFVVVQFRYLFGGAARVEASTTLTYAEYARRGFFELVTVAALALPLLLAVHWLLRPSREVEQTERREERRLRSATPRPLDPSTPPLAAGAEPIFRLLAGAQVALLGVVLASALQRLRLYYLDYGLTELRLYTTAFMAWVAIVLVWFALTVLRDRRERFAAGALLAAGIVVIILHVLNPDALIVRTNAARAAAPGGRPFDAGYALSLSADAVPALVATLPNVPPPDRCLAAAELLDRWATDGEDWRSRSWGRDAARRAVRGHEAALRACR